MRKNIVLGIPTIAIIIMTILGCTNITPISDQTEIKVVQNQNEQNKNDDSITTDDLVSNIDTSDWQTYRNKEYGIEFAYPENYALKDCSYNTSDLVSVYISDVDVSCNDPGGRINVSFFLGDYAKARYKDYEHITYQSNNLEKIDRFVTTYEVTGPAGEIILSHPKIKTVYSFAQEKNGYVTFSYSEIFEVAGSVKNSGWQKQSDLFDIYESIVKSYKGS